MVVVTAGTTVSAITIAAGTFAIATRAAVTAVTVTAWTFAAAVMLYVAFGFGFEGTHGQTVFACLLVDFDKLDLNGVAFVKAAGFHVGETFPGDFADVEQSVAVGHKFDKCAEVHDGLDFAGVYLAFFGQGNDGVDKFEGFVDAGLVGCGHFDISAFVDFVDADGGAGSLLDALDNFSARANDCTDKFFGYNHCDDARNLRLVVFARCGYCLLDDVEDVHTTFVSLHERFFEDFVGESVALDIHLRGGDAVACARNLEVHISEVVFVAEDVAQDGVFGRIGVGDQAHSDTADGFLHLDTCVKQCQRAGAYGGHGRRAVGLENVADYAAYVGEVVGEHALEGAVCQVAVADFATAYAALCLGFAGGEGRKVVVQQEAFATLIEHIVQDFFVQLCAEGDGGQSLSFTAGEYGASVRSGQVVGFAPDGAYFGGFSAIQTDAFVEDAAAYGFAFYVVVVAFDQRGFFVALFFGKCIDVFLANCVKGVLTPVLVGAAGLGYGVSAVIAFVVYVFAQVFVVDFVAIFAFYFAYGFGEFHLDFALLLDGGVCGLEGCQEVGFGHFVHFAFDHHDIVVGGAYHQLHIGLFELLECGVDDKFAVDACNAHLGDGAVERYVADGEGGTGCQSGQGVRHVYAVGREHDDVDERVGVVIVGEKGTQYAVHEARGQNFVIVGAAFAFEEAAGEASCCREFFFVFDLERHKVYAFAGFLGGDDCCQKHGIAHAELHGAISLFGQFAGLQRNLAPVGQCDGLFDGVHNDVWGCFV